MNNPLHTLSILLIILVFTMACTVTGSTDGLENGQWELQALGTKNQPDDALQTTPPITVKFEPNENRVTGFAGCNRYLGRYELIENELSILGALSLSRKYCQQPFGIMDQEKRYIRLLATAEHFRFESGALTIDCADGQVVVFTRQTPGF